MEEYSGLVRLRSYAKVILIGVCVLGLSSLVRAQDPTFSLFNINQVYLNPAFVGANGDLTAGFNSRAQWTRVPSRFQTNMAYVTGSCPNWNLGLGLRLYDDTEGEGYMRNTNAAGMVSIHFPGRFGRGIRALRNKKFIWSFGMQIAAGQRRLDWEDLVFSDQLDPYLGLYLNRSQVNPQNEVSNLVVDLGAGTRFRFAFGDRGSHLSMGLAGFHLNNPVESFFGLETRLKVRTTGYLYTHFQTSRYSNNPHYLSLGWVMDHQQVLRTNTFNINYDVMSNLLIGLSYRKKHVFMIDNDFDSFILSFMYSVGSLTMGYSYDFTLPNLGVENTAGTHEIGIIYTFKDAYICRKGRRRPRALDCFSLGMGTTDRSSNYWRQ